MKYINADKLKERICNHYNPKLYEHIFKIIEELSEEREDAEWKKTNPLEKNGQYIPEGKQVLMYNDNTKETKVGVMYSSHGYCDLPGVTHWIDLPKEQPTPLKVAIKGDGTEEYGKKIIDYFKDYAIPTACNGKSKLYYYINEVNIIVNSPTLPKGYKEISLKEEEKVVTDNSKVNTYLLKRVEELEKELTDLKLKLKDLIK